MGIILHILITGGAGFIGSNLAIYYLNRGNKITVIDDLSTGHYSNVEPLIKNPNFCFHKHNLVSWKKLEKVLLDVDRIYHMAAIVGMFYVLKHPLQVLQVNMGATLKLFETIRKLGIKPLVFIASSSEVYGSQHQVLAENTPLIFVNSSANHTAYAISKLCDESIAMAYWHEHQIPSIVLRIFNTIGRNQLSKYGMVVPRFIKQAIKNEDITVFGDGGQIRSFCDIRDSINLMDLLANNPKCVGEVINLGNSEPISINELAELVKRISQSDSSITHLPIDDIYHNGYINIVERTPNLTKLLSYTHYKYQWTLEKTIKDIVDYERTII